MTTIKDVARLAGVSPSTVSKYINGGHVRLENLEAIRQAIDKLDYRVNPFARNLKTRRSRSVGVLLPSISASFYGAVFVALDKVLRERGYHTMISCYSSNHGLERDYLNCLISAGVDGLIYMPEDLTADEFRELTAGRSLPVVQVDRMIPGVAADAVLTDNAEAVRSAMGRLIARGRRRIAIIAGPKAVLTAQERLAGYLRALDEHGILYDDALVVSGELCFATGYQGFLQLMGSGSPPSAVFSTNYDITLGVVTAARERGVQIPEDIDVWGYDCVNICRMMTPPLPVLHQPEQELGQKTAEYLIERLAGYSGPPRLTRLACELII